MGKKIGSLFYEIGADSSKFEDALQKVKSGVITAKADMQKLADQTTRLGGDFRQTGGIVDDWIGALRASTPENLRFAASVDNITTQFSNGKLSAAEAADKLEAVKREMRDSAPAAEKFKTALHGVSNAIAGITGAAAIVGVTVKKIFDFGEEGAKLEYAQSKFDNLAASIGTTSDALKNDLRGATKGLVADSELVASAGDFMALGLAKTHDEVVRLTRVAGALGMDMNQLVLTLTNQTTMRFDALGVSVDGFDEKVKALEQSGMDAGAAFKEAFLRQAEEQIGKIGDKADSGAAAFARLDAATKNAGDALKLYFAPAITSAAVGLTKIINGGNEVAAAFEEHAETMTGVAKTYEEYRKEMIRAAEVAGQWNIDMTTAELYGMGAATDEAWNALGLLNEEQWIAEHRARVFAEAVADGRIQVQTYADTIDSEAIPATRNFYDSLVSLDDIDPQFDNKIKSALDDLKFQLAGGLPLQKMTEDIIAAFNAGKITPEQAQEMLGEALVGSETLKVKMGEITGDDAAKNISETLGVSLDDAKQLILDMHDELNNLPRNIDVRLNFIETGDRSPGRQSDTPEEFYPSNDPYNVKGGNNGDTYASGGQFIIPPGYEDHSWPVGPGRYAESGETVTITPEGESSAAGMTIIQNIYTQLDYEVAAAEIMERIRRER